MHCNPVKYNGDTFFRKFLERPLHPIAIVKSAVLKVTEDDVLDVLERLLLTSISSVVTKEFVLNSIMKLSTRFTVTTK